MFPLKDNIPTLRFPVVTVALIVLNAIVYFFLQDGLLGLPQNGLGGDWPTPTYATIPCEITGATPCDTVPGGPAPVVTLVFIIFFFTILELPAIIFLGIWIIEQALFAYFDLVQPDGGGGGVAYFAHLGGVVFGLLFIRAFAIERRRRRQLERIGMA